MPDPLTLPLHETAIVVTAVITFAEIVRWFGSQRHLTAGNADAVGVLIARRMAGRPYHEVDAGFGPGKANTQLVKVVYDEKTKTVLAAEAEVSATPPTRPPSGRSGQAADWSYSAESSSGRGKAPRVPEGGGGTRGDRRGINWRMSLLTGTVTSTWRLRQPDPVHPGLTSRFMTAP